MGIPQLLPFVKSIAQPVHLSELSGKTVAIDISGWLHRGLFSCALEVESGQPTDKFLDVALRCLDLFATHGVRPLVVFDGAVLPQKEQRAHQPGGRTSERAKSRERAIELLREGRQHEAAPLLGKATGVAPWMATRLIDELRARDIPFVVAPYEADPQLAFLVREGHADAALSDDSDLLAYGCPRCLYKFNERTGTAEMLAFSALRSAEDASGNHLFDGQCANEWAA